jgi:hypothetical protein
MSGQPTVIYHAANTQQAFLLKSVLEERGIPAWVVNDNIQVAGGELPLGWTAAAQVVVGENDAGDAREIAEDFDRTTAHEPAPELPTGEPIVAAWKDWPACPQCQALRQARCTLCGISRTDFPLADLSESGGETRVLLVCEDCQDHFRPEFYRLCHQCGHDFSDGIEVGGPATDIEATRRTWLVLGTLLAGLLLFIGYVYWVMR